MSHLYKWEFKEFFQNDREKLIQLFISEIVFLNQCLIKAKKRQERKIIKKNCRKLEKLLITQQRLIEVNLSDEEYKIVILMIIQGFNKIVNKLS
ncbi:MAG: hypothetical protein ACFFHV_18600 [Promethearchaeota archaeon]